MSEELPPGWERVDPPVTRRSERMVQLEDGRVLRIVEPFDDEEVAADVFDPATGAWTETQPQRNSKVRDRAIVVTAEGWVHASGGMNEGLDRGMSAACDLFKPATGEWIEMPPLPLPSYLHRAVVSGGRIHVIGGKAKVPRRGQQDVKTFASWAPGDTSWTALPDTLFVVSSPTARVLDDGDIIVWGFAIVDQALRWTRGAWHAIDPIDNGAAVLPLDEGFLAIGGERSRVEHPRVRSVGARKLPDLPAPRKHARAIMLRDGRIAVIGGVRTLMRWAHTGGVRQSVMTEVPERTLFLWDGTAWSEHPSPPLYGRGAFVLHDGRVFVHDVSMTAIWTP